MITLETRHESYVKTMPKAFTRQQEILRALGNSTLTAREIKDILGYDDMNDVKPRLTELMYQTQIEVVGKCKDKKTRRMVAIYKAVK